ncbi:hypothetical protein BH11MYX2_BH11MYX2_10730 [soil metagenome]
MTKSARIIYSMRVSWLCMALLACSSSKDAPQDSGADTSPPADAAPITTLSLTATRIPDAGLDPFEIAVTVKVDGTPTTGKTLTLAVPRGTASVITDNGDGTYAFTVTPTTTGVYPVSINVDGVTLSRSALVMDTVADGVGQAMLVPGLVNTPGYEDGITITPDGQYLFVQYGPLYFAGLTGVATICSDASLAIGYNLNDCAGRTNAAAVFNTVGPTGAPERPRFHDQAILNGKLRFLPGFVIPGTANGLAAFPTLFYGFHRQADGSYAEPFRVGFDDPKGINGPFGLSFVQPPSGPTKFVVAWNNSLDNLGDDGADIYAGELTLGADHSLGAVTYGTALGGDSFASITPTVTAVPFASNAGNQGNPHLTADANGTVTAIWTDDESASHDLSVYRLTAGAFPAGTWTKQTLPAVINTTGEESQPFFTGDFLVLNRNLEIVAHAYTPTAVGCNSTYTAAACWGPEIVLLAANTHTNAGTIYGVGEPTVATIDGVRTLFFAYVEVRDPQPFPGLVDYDLGAASVPVP